MPAEKSMANHEMLPNSGFDPGSPRRSFPKRLMQRSIGKSTKMFMASIYPQPKYSMRTLKSPLAAASKLAGEKIPQSTVAAVTAMEMKNTELSFLTCILVPPSLISGGGGPPPDGS